MRPSIPGCNTSGSSPTRRRRNLLGLNVFLVFQGIEDGLRISLQWVGIGCFSDKLCQIVCRLLIFRLVGVDGTDIKKCLTGTQQRVKVVGISLKDLPVFREGLIE